MKKVILKICGITNTPDALEASLAGADMLGLIFVSTSPRSVELGEAREIIQAVRAETDHPPKIVGVFQNNTVAEMTHYIDFLTLDYAQLHGGESLETCRALPVPVFKTIIIHPIDIDTLSQQIQRYPVSQASNIEALLLDLPKQTSQEDLLSFCLPDEVQLALREIRHLVAGRLTPDNIQETLETFKPDGVDVASGIEQSPGKKDLVKMQTFCRMVRKRLGESQPCSH